ncbi:unnamed protein product [Hymenolepis diminuta]|uniref:RT_RNaseH_2 domain-containing protein n=1 Tax=Hymenolepis diminuta TaxID=6216 RepID=A0A564Y087_HYMDI|nr:unnamed protein product [Hymenolepis diminuta]
MFSPTNLDLLRSFLGSITYYNSFLPSLHKHRAPLNQFLHKETPYERSPACKWAFEKLNSMLNSELLLVHYDLCLPIVLAADVSGYGTEIVTSQIFPNGSKKRPHISHGGKELRANRKGDTDRYICSKIFHKYTYTWQATYTPNGPEAIVVNIWL